MKRAQRDRILLADDAECALGALALQLTSLGLDPLYTNDADEAVLLAAQEARRIGAVAFPVTLPTTRLDALIKGVATRVGLRGEAMVPIGARPDDATMLALRERGMRWALWEPFDEAGVRFVLATVLERHHSDSDLRLEPRIPAHGLEGRLYKGAIGRDVRVIDLSVGGAFLASDRPMPDGASVTLELSLPGSTPATLRLRALVRWARRDAAAERVDLHHGMGVEFEEPGPELRTALRRYVQAQMARYMVTSSQRRA